MLFPRHQWRYRGTGPAESERPLTFVLPRLLPPRSSLPPHTPRAPHLCRPYTPRQSNAIALQSRPIGQHARLAPGVRSLPVHARPRWGCHRTFTRRRGGGSATSMRGSIGAYIVYWSMILTLPVPESPSAPLSSGIVAMVMALLFARLDRKPPPNIKCTRALPLLVSRSR